MLSIPSRVAIVEVGPRDGLQSFSRWVDTADKVHMIDRLSMLGPHTIEVASFAHPTAVPFLRDAEAVFEQISRKPGIVYRGLVPNARGAERAAQARVGEMLGLITASETYTLKNQNMSIDAAVEQNLLAFRVAERHAIPFVMAIGMAFWCAYEGTIPEERVIDIVRRLRDGGIRRFYLAGSLGMEDPAHVNRLFLRIRDRYPDASLGFHPHNLSGMAAANILGALDAGVDWLEGAICGIGGGIAMPAQLGSLGNFPTEDLVMMLSEMGIDTGMDAMEAVSASRDIAALLRTEPRSHRANGATRQEIAGLGTNGSAMR